MRYLLVCVFLGSSAFADHPKIAVTVDGTIYQCGNGSGPVGNVSECINSVHYYCKWNTSLGSDPCYSKAAAECPGQTANYPKCVESTHYYCKWNTSLGSDLCFNQALNTCQGSSDAIVEMMAAVKERARSKN